MQTCNISRKCTNRARSIVQKTYLEHTLRPYMVASLRVVRHHIRRSPPDFDRPCRYSHAAFVFVLCHMSQSNHSISSSHPRCILEEILKYCIFCFSHQSSRSEKLRWKCIFKKKCFSQRMHFHRNVFSFDKDANTEITKIFEKFQCWLKIKIKSHDLRDSLHGWDSILSPGHSEQPGGPQVQERERVRSPLHGSQHSPHSLHCVQHSINMIKNS